jgi:hypothetical protein
MTKREFCLWNGEKVEVYAKYGEWWILIRPNHLMVWVPVDENGILAKEPELTVSPIAEVIEQ